MLFLWLYICLNFILNINILDTLQDLFNNKYKIKQKKCVQNIYFNNKIIIHQNNNFLIKFEEKKHILCKIFNTRGKLFVVCGRRYNAHKLIVKLQKRNFLIRKNR